MTSALAVGYSGGGVAATLRGRDADFVSRSLAGWTPPASACITNNWLALLAVRAFVHPRRHSESTERASKVFTGVMTLVVVAVLIVAVAALFGWILSVEAVPQKLTALMLSISTNPYVLLLLVNVLLIIVGMFLDSTTAILVIAPIIAKPLVAAGVDPVHLGMVVVFNLMIGLLTPPMGLALFLVTDIAKVSMKDVLKEMAPYYVPLGITLLLITYVPGITTWIPRWALGN